ncbi:MAG: ABC transporter substrate-binding protein [Acidimicrobiales bacterium]|nr:ABC transporter substrate-binding protein [Acidimicrobiales bacterium]
MRQRSWLRWLAVLCIVVVVGAACSDDDSESSDGTNVGDDGGGDDSSGDDGTSDGTSDDGTSDDGTGDDGGEPVSGSCDATVPDTQINYGTFAPSSVLDPTRASGALVGGTELAAVYDVLFIFDHETGDYVPHLAESLEPNDDYTEWTLTLRDDITYSDGTPLDAQMVSDHMDRFFDEGVRNTSAGFLTPIVEKTVVDATTLVMTLDAPWVEFPFVFADEPGMVVNLNAIGDDIDAFGAMPSDAAGVGPYVVERNAPGEELVFVARDDYWGGPVCVERLRFVFNPGTTYESFQAGDLNVAFLRSPAEISLARANGEEEFFAKQDGGSVLIINQREDRPGNDPRVREAIILAIDTAVVSDRAYAGDLTEGKSLIIEGSRFYSDAIVEAETDAARASELLAEAMADGYDGTLEVLCSTTPPAPDTALAVEALLEGAGFDVTVETIGQGDQIGAVVQGNYDTACWGFNAGPATATTTFGRNLRSDSASNRMGYASAEMDAALDAILGAESGQAQLDAFAEMNRIFVEDHVAAGLGSIDEGIVFAPEVDGIVPTVATIFLFHDAVIAG